MVRLLYFDVKPKRTEFCVTNGYYSIVLSEESEAYNVCNVLNRIIQDLGIVGCKIGR